MSKEFEEEYKNQPTIFCNIRELERAARTGRTKGFSDWEGKVKTYPLSVCSPTDVRLFFKFMLDVEVGNELQKIIGWAHPELLLLFAAGLVDLCNNVQKKVHYIHTLFLCLFKRAQSFNTSIFHECVHGIVQYLLQITNTVPIHTSNTSMF